jgi:MFS family permease
MRTASQSQPSISSGAMSASSRCIPISMRSGSLRRRYTSSSSSFIPKSPSLRSKIDHKIKTRSVSVEPSLSSLSLTPYRYNRSTFGRYLSTQAAADADATTATITDTPATPTAQDDKSQSVRVVYAVQQQQPQLPMELPLLYRYLRLETFTELELQAVFERIRGTDAAPAADTAASTVFLDSDDDFNDGDGSTNIDAHDLQRFFVQRYRDFEVEFSDSYHIVHDDEATTDSFRQQQAYRDAQAFLRVFDNEITNVRDDPVTSTSLDQSSSPPSSGDGTTATLISKADFLRVIREKATRVDLPRTMPITASMLLVGASVGVITPAMPFVVESLALTTSQYGMTVAAFGLAKMAANIPSAIAVERHGRKPYLTYSLAVVALGVGGIGLAGSFEELYVCRLLTGLGVAALSTAGTMMIADLSTPLNRASTMAPVMSAFAAGTALGPALGGFLVDQVGLNPTFYIVGVSYLGVAVINKHLLKETKSMPIHFSWQQKAPKSVRLARAEQDTLTGALQDAVGQWVPLLQDPKIRNVMVMHGLYWVALAGAQMTLLPLILTDVDGLAMSATQLGSVYMGMSLVQIFGNPLFARYIDRIGKAPAIVAGCTLISTAMAGLPFCQDVPQLAVALGIWSVGSSMLSTAPIAYVSDQVAESKRAQAFALLRTCGDVGFLVGASGTGALADWAGSLDVAMHSSAGLLLTATGWFATRQLLTSQLTTSSTTTTTTTSTTTPASRRNKKEL